MKVLGIITSIRLHNPVVVHGFTQTELHRVYYTLSHNDKMANKYTVDIPKGVSVKHGVKVLNELGNTIGNGNLNISLGKLIVINNCGASWEPGDVHLLVMVKIIHQGASASDKLREMLTKHNRFDIHGRVIDGAGVKDWWG